MKIPFRKLREHKLKLGRLKDEEDECNNEEEEKNVSNG